MKEGLEKIESEYATKIIELIRKYGKPIVPASLPFRESEAMRFLSRSGVFIYPTPEKAARVFACMSKYQEKCKAR